MYSFSAPCPWLRAHQGMDLLMGESWSISCLAFFFFFFNISAVFNCFHRGRKQTNIFISVLKINARRQWTLQSCKLCCKLSNDHRSAQQQSPIRMAGTCIDFPCHKPHTKVTKQKPTSSSFSNFLDFMLVICMVGVTSCQEVELWVRLLVVPDPNLELRACAKTRRQKSRIFQYIIHQRGSGFCPH